jgi:drug/metabolite transporter (DMT)-like permease
MGVFILHEQANIYTALSFCAIMCSVFLVKKGYQQQQIKHAALAAQATEAK